MVHRGFLPHHPEQRFGERHRHHNEHGRHEDRAYTEWYTYLASFGNIASGATASPTQPLQVQADSDFEIRKITFIAEPHGGTAPFADNFVPELAIQITDSGSGRQLFSAATPLSATAGKGSLPFILPITYIFEAKSIIQMTLTNFSAVGSGGGALQWDNVYVALIGNKIWKFGKPQ